MEMLFTGGNSLSSHVLGLVVDVRFGDMCIDEGEEY